MSDDTPAWAEGPGRVKQARLPSRKFGLGIGFKTPESFCPHCARLWDGAGNLDNPRARQPRAGDLAVCIGCAGINQYEPGLRLRAVDPAELPALEAEQPGVVAEIKAIQRQMVRVIALAVAETGEPPQGKPIGSGRTRPS